MKVCKDKKGGDKKLHAFVCFVLAAVVGALAAHVPGVSDWGAAGIAFAVAMAVGAWKEIRDARAAGNHFCPWDLLADFAGAWLGAGVVWLAGHFINVYI
ncbi:hypothetical protein IMSAGC006_02292 [Muribaculaceae bacterium]|jgi:uncharacterized protein YfiM (DUF2279 family)|uniref:hypothetical protein n=1 Tax=Duncaniella muris TaxID=2094150 RepID=UPI0014339006|nr:hypothetical protein [Duncaniella muris]GFI07535.1 hypothetical protein IMSAGC006_02292 [Muribaculaceae bacterium]